MEPRKEASYVRTHKMLPLYDIVNAHADYLSVITPKYQMTHTLFVNIKHGKPICS